MTPAARAVLGFAKAEAQALGCHYVGTEHLLLGLMREPTSHVARVLAADTDLESVRAQVREVVGIGEDVPSGDLPMTPRARQVLQLARREADLYHAEQIAPEHLLIGILREGEGIAMQVLPTLGVVDFGRVLAELTDHWRHDAG
jgi:ATP-dependent Clp protease ATP-binding subunit ClpC